MHDRIPENVSNGIKIAVVDLLKPSGTQEKVAKDDVEFEKCKTTRPKHLTKSNFVIFAAEFLGTGALMFMGCMGCINGVVPVEISHHMSSIAFGLVVMLIIQMFGHISGAHLNPAVTIASVFLGYLKITLLPLYFLAEFTGALAGFALLKVLVAPELTYPKNATAGVCSTVPHKSMSQVQAVVLEAILTTILILVCAAVWDKRNADKPDSVPLRFGFIIAVIGMVAGPFTGASMNTVRSFAPAVLNGDWEAQWVYWVGPTLGAIVGSGLYRTFFAPPTEEDVSSDNDEITVNYRST
ncbi:Entomoglyceroporin-3 [Rhyzopertha dominica]|nr:Entomoglyceroporin-3 [Rhyzopertha dominica]